PCRVRLEERARRLLVVRPVAGHAREEATERGLDPPHALVPGALLDHVLDEPPQGARDPRVLLFEPVPVPGQERPFAARDPERRRQQPLPRITPRSCTRTIGSSTTCPVSAAPSPNSPATISRTKRWMSPCATCQPSARCGPLCLASRHRISRSGSPSTCARIS